MKSLFNSIRVKRPKKNVFDLSHNVKMSMDMGRLVPFLCEPVVPGDKWRVNSSALIRFSPLVSPVMDEINVYYHYFFVPYRLIWDGWKDFITGGEKPGTTPPPYPLLNFGVINGSESTGYDPVPLTTVGSLADYLGFPTNTFVNKDPTNYSAFDALPFRAYQLIYNEYYRDENLQAEVDICKDVNGVLNDKQKLIELTKLRTRAWEHDYFTSALPWPQKGEDIELPLMGDGDIIPPPSSLSKVIFNNSDISSAASWVDSYGNNLPNKNYIIEDYGDSKASTSLEGDRPIDTLAYYNPRGSLKVSNSELLNGAKVDLSNVSSATINELRRAIKAQEFLEASARGGTRYIEFIKSIFGVNSSDARLQRPEYLGGGKQPVVISDVTQTSSTNDVSPQGNPAGVAGSVGSSRQFKRFFEEYGYVIGIMSVLPRTSYMQGLPRKYQKFDRFDYYIPQFAHLGEQEIKNSEVYFNFGDTYVPGNPGNPNPAGYGTLNDGVFGYIPRYAEYKDIPNRIAGDFKTSLDFWHMARTFDKTPALNNYFIESRPTDRIFAVTDDGVQKLWVNIGLDIKAIRPMPVYGTPYM